MKFRRLASLMLLSAFYSIPILAQYDDSRIKVGLVLSGGGARGGAHVGVLRVLEELNIEVDCIAGTSMGAIIGGFYAAGYSADEIERLLVETDWNRALTDNPDRRDRTMRKKELESEFLIPYRLGYNDGRFQAPLGAIEGQHLDQIFQRILRPVVKIRDFDALPIPFRAVATDLVTGEEVVLSQGSLADALRASMSVPGVFDPVRIEGRILVDGGMANNLPVSVARAMGADVIIAVDISTPMLEEEQLTSVLSVTEQLTNFLTRRTTDQQIASLGPEDILIVPELGDFSAADFQGAWKIVPLGEEAARSEQDRLAGLSGAGEPRPRAAERLVQADTAKPVDFVEIRNNSVLNDELVRSRLAAQVGQPLDMDELDRSLDRIYSLDVFESVTYDLAENEAGEQGVIINARARPWGPTYLQFGLELANDFSGSSNFKIGAGYTRNALNSLGGELRVVTSFGREDELRFDIYQPVDLTAQWFVNPKIRWLRRNFNLWADDARLAEFEVGGWDAWLGIGRNFGTTDRLRLDYRFGRAEADLITGFLPVPYDDQVDLGELVLGYQHDSVDSLYFPTSGMLHNLSYRYADESLGAALDYQQAAAAGSLVLTHGRNTATLSYEAGYSFDDAAPLERWYQLGGLGRLSGLAPDQLSGRHVGLLSLALYRRLNDIQFFPAYAGLTIEAGNVWNLSRDIGLDDLRYSGSLFIGAESPIGPVYLAAGYSDSGDAAVYFYVGNPFRPNRFD
jgi:NTE family protein